MIASPRSVPLCYAYHQQREIGQAAFDALYGTELLVTASVAITDLKTRELVLRLPDHLRRAKTTEIYLQYLTPEETKASNVGAPIRASGR
jgi:hypothetical protein